MNLDDLKQTLTTMADEVHLQDPVARMEGVDTKVRAARRRQVAGAASLGVAAVAAVLALVVPGSFSGWPDRGPTPAGRGTSASTGQPPTHTSPDIVETTLPTVSDKGAMLYHGVTIARETVVAGHSYRLVARKFNTFTHSPARLSLELPASAPLFVVSGVRGISSRYVVIEPDGTLDKSMVGGASEAGSLLGDGQQVATMKVRSPHDTQGLIYLLIYEQVD